MKPQKRKEMLQKIFEYFQQITQWLPDNINVAYESMFNLFKKKKSIEEEGTEFTFIWYKKMVNGNKTHYTQPFRTKVKAKTREEAIKKVENFALQKMTLVVVEESKFTSNKINLMTKEFDKLNEQFEKMIKRKQNYGKQK